MNKLFHSIKCLIVQSAKLNCSESISFRQYSVTPLTKHANQVKSVNTDSTNPLVRFHFSHPERVKQFVKARNGHIVCNYIDSERYKKHIQDKVELQKKIVFENFPKEILPRDIKFEHVLDCAQPVPKIKKRKNKVDQAQVLRVTPPPQKAKPKKKVPESVMSSILKKKKEEEIEDIHPRQRKTSILPVVLAEAKKRKDKQNEFRKRTTVLPIILKQSQKRILNDKSK